MVRKVKNKMNKLKNIFVGTSMVVGIGLASISTAGAANAAPTIPQTGITQVQAVKIAANAKTITTIKTTANLNLRASNNTKAKVITVLKKGTAVKVLSSKSGWKKVKANGKTGWASAKYLATVKSTVKTAKKAAPKKTSSSTVRNKVVKNAKANLGVKYRFGGTSPKTGWDCSGYVQYVFKKSGVNVPRTKAWVGKKKVSKAQAKPGDLVVSYNGGHVGIYAGGGKQYHSANPGTGTVHAPIYAKDPVFYSVVK